MVRKVCGPPMSKMKARCISGSSRISTPYGVRNWRRAPDALHRVCGSSSLASRSAAIARAHGWYGMLSMPSGFPTTGPGCHTPFSAGVAPPSITRPVA